MLNIRKTQKYFAGKTFVDLFAGMGGFHLAMKSLGAKCIWACDNDKHACETYEQNFGMNPMCDITTVDAADVPDHDILCAGFPCTAFSIAGKKRGFEDTTRGTLFFDVARIIKEKRPEMVFLENVKNFARHDGGRTIEVVQDTLEELGYSFAWKMMPSNEYGAATKRERVYMVCFRKDLGVIDFEFPRPTGTSTYVKDVLLPSDDPRVSKCWVDRDDITWLRDEKYRCSSSPVRLGIAGDGSQGYRIYSTRAVGVTLAATGGGAYAKTGGYLVDGRVRTLAPREAARLMGFRDNYKLNRRDNQALKQCGNSVVVDVIQLVALEMGKAYRNRIGSVPTPVASSHDVLPTAA